MNLSLAIVAVVSTLLPFDGSTGWINSKPLTPASLVGKVVLVDFWEYTCINCLKTLPYERTWYDRYAKYGFTIVGVHTPEFAFSGESENVAQAVKRLGIDWPVVLDSRQAIWDRYGNDVWPRELLFDANGKLILDHSGEGDYPDTERRIQQALHARGAMANFPPPMDYLPVDSYSKPGAVCYRHTPEMYLGNWRGDGVVAAIDLGDPGVESLWRRKDCGVHRRDGARGWTGVPARLVVGIRTGDGKRNRHEG